MNFIKHIIETKKLSLIWQAPEGCDDRARRVVGELRLVGGNVELRYLVDSDDYLAAKECGFQGYPAFFKTDIVHCEGVLEAFMKRLPPRKRPDFVEYLEHLGLRPDVEITDFALLGYSGARLPSDWFAIVMPFEDVSGPCEFLTEVAGFRYSEGEKSELSIGDQVTFEPEPENQHDSNAIRVIHNGINIGYIGRGQLDSFHRWLRNDQISATIEKINGRPDRPSIVLFVRVEAC